MSTDNTRINFKNSFALLSPGFNQVAEKAVFVAPSTYAKHKFPHVRVRILRLAEYIISTPYEY